MINTAAEKMERMGQCLSENGYTYSCVIKSMLNVFLVITKNGYIKSAELQRT